MRAKTQMMKKLLLLAMPNRLFKRVSKSNNKFYNKKIILRLNKNILNEYLLKDLFCNLYVCLFFCLIFCKANKFIYL